MARLFLLRHAQPVGDGVKRFVGQTDPPLSAEGRLQATWWRDRLERVDFSRIFSSDLTRAQETADLVGANRQTGVTVLSDLREIHLGTWENQAFSDIREQFPRQWHARGKDLAGFRPPGGESFADLQNRVVPKVKEILDKGSGNILVVAHAGVNRAILCWVMGIPLNLLFSFAQDPAGLSLIDADSPQLRVMTVNLAPATLAWAGIHPGAAQELNKSKSTSGSLSKS